MAEAGNSGEPRNGCPPLYSIPLDVGVVKDMALRRVRRRVLRRNAFYMLLVAIAVALALGGLATLVRFDA